MPPKRLRQYPRAQVKLRVGVDGVPGKDSRYFTRNVSAGGLYLIIQPSLAMGRSLELELLTGDGAIRLVARVVRQEEFGCAVEFSGVSPDTREQLRRLVGALLCESMANIEAPGEQPRDKTYWSKGESAVPARLSKLSEHGAQLEGAEVPELYERIRVFLPREPVAEGGEASFSECSAQVIDRQEGAFSVAFMEHRTEFMHLVQDMLDPPREVIH